MILEIPCWYTSACIVSCRGRVVWLASIGVLGVMTFRIVINVKPIDTEFAGKIMPMPPEKVKDKVLKDMTSRFTCLEREAGRAIDAEDLLEMARAAVAHAFGVKNLAPGVVTEIEHAYSNEFRAQYEADDWTFAKSEGLRFGNLIRNDDTVGYGRVKAVGGLIWSCLLYTSDAADE